MQVTEKKIIGPFKQLLTMNHLPLKGALADEQLETIPLAGILIENGLVRETGNFETLIKQHKKTAEVEHINGTWIATPGFIDPHTHICWAGNRAHDYAMRLEGKSYIEIAKSGGGIWDTVTKTRQASLEELVRLILERAERHLSDGITTIEVKSGYGLTVDQELKILHAIALANKSTAADLVPTCLAAHICPKDFWGKSSDYLNMMLEQLLPEVMAKKLSKRVDIYLEDSAFSPEEGHNYLLEARRLGFDLTVHADQFTAGGSKIATQLMAMSADHLEASEEEEIRMLAESNTIAIALPGASIGLADPFAPARRLLDAGAGLAIGSDWNPGSAPMGDLLVQASLLGMYEKLNTAETLSAITFRAAAALGLTDRGILKTGSLADIAAFQLGDYKDILYNQGRIKPQMVWKKGNLITRINT
ncbi:MAG: imidazolonepropionase [Bacteroidota bacterium]|nr:MAG: imidazolonepropionase [Bacteroidota bacterium]